MAEEAAKTLEKVLDSLQPYPEMQLLLFSGRWGPLETTLLRFAEREGHTILLYTLSEELVTRLPDSTQLKHRSYRIEQPRYNLRGRLYNHAFVFDTVPDTPESFARKIYTGIANAGGLYLLLKGEEAENAARWERVLLGSNYVAANPIGLDDRQILLSARKMHGWGG